MKGALDVHQTLLGAGVPHEIVHLRSRLLSADDLPRVLDVERGCVAVRCYAVECPSGPRFAAVLVPAGTAISPIALLDTLGAQSAQPAGAEQINAVTDYAAGLVSPVCLPPGIELLADTALRSEDVAYCAVGEGSVALAIHTNDLLRVTGARLAPVTSHRDKATGTAQPTWRDRVSKVRWTG